MSPWLPQQPEVTLFHFLLPEQNQQKVQHQPVVSIHVNHLRQFIHAAGAGGRHLMLHLQNTHVEII